MISEIFKAISRSMIIIILAMGFISSAPLSAFSQETPGNAVKRTGRHGHNQRTTIENGKVAVVKGTIYEVDGNSIVMDGESFSISSALIVNQVGGEVKPNQLYPGLRVKLMIRRGSVERVVIENFYWNNIRTSPEDLEKKRQKALERRGR